jgi:hypothetical protein
LSERAHREDKSEKLGHSPKTDSMTPSDVGQDAILRRVVNPPVDPWRRGQAD